MKRQPVKKKKEYPEDVNKSEELTNYLSKLLDDIRTKEIDQDIAALLIRTADKMNKNHIAAIYYKRMTKGKKKIDFFE